MLTNWNKIIKIIRLIKGEWSKTLQLSKGNDAWNSGEVDPCAHGRRRRITCFTNNSLHFRNSSETRGAYRAERCTPKPPLNGEGGGFITTYVHTSYFPSSLFLSIHPPFFAQVGNPQRTKADWHLFSRVHSGGAGVTHRAHPKLSGLTNSLSSTPAEISPHMSQPMDPILNERACVCVWVGVIRPLTSMWPDLFLAVLWSCFATFHQFNSTVLLFLAVPRWCSCHTHPCKC